MIHLRIIEKLKEAKKDLESLVSQGQLDNFESYKYYTGRIQGFKDSINIIQDLIKGNYDE